MLARLSFIAGMLTLVSGVSHAEEKEGMPQLDPHSYSSQIFWLVVFFVLVFGFIRFIGLPRLTAILDERQRRITGDEGAAEQLRTEADQTLKAYEASLAEAHGRARGMIAEVNAKNAAALAEQTKAATAEFDKRIADAVSRIDAAQAAALASVREVALGLAADITTKIAGRTPSADSVARAVDAAGKVGVA